MHGQRLQVLGQPDGQLGVRLRRGPDELQDGSGERVSSDAVGVGHDDGPMTLTEGEVNALPVCGVLLLGHRGRESFRAGGPPLVSILIVVIVGRHDQDLRVQRAEDGRGPASVGLSARRVVDHHDAGVCLLAEPVEPAHGLTHVGGGVLLQAEGHTGQGVEYDQVDVILHDVVRKPAPEIGTGPD